MNSTPCPSRHDLSDYVSGKLPDGLSDSIATHLSSCKVCQETLLACDDATDPLMASLRIPRVDDPYAQEPGCREAIALVEAIGREPSISMECGSAGILASPEDLGTVGQYRLLAKLGTGGMGTVYKALHTRLDKVVALKLLPRERTRDSSAIARFAREMRAIGRLEHPHIVRAMDANELDGTHYLVMEYVEGLDLGELARRRGRLAIADACELVCQAALGLQYAHEHGLVHRDIKPSNLMLTRQGQVKILDLGLALLRADEPPNREMTGDGQMMGTVDFMAPEQATDAHSVDIRADIYSLGCTLFKLLAGQTPFAASARHKPLEVILAHLQQPFPSVRDVRPEVPEELASILSRMTAKSPCERFTTPAEIAVALAPFAADSNLRRLSDELAAPVVPGTVIESSRTNTDDYVSSAMTDTTPSSLTPVADTVTLLPAAARGAGRRRFWIALAAVAAALPLCFGIWIIVRDNSGREIGRMLAPNGSTVTTIDEQEETVAAGTIPKRTDEKSVTPTTAGQSPQLVSIELTPEPLDLPEGAPLSKMALVAQPAALPGVRSWTIETIGHRGSDAIVAYSPNGRWLATSCSDETIRLWDAATGDFIRAIVAHDRSITRICWSPDGKILASSSLDGTVRLWDPELGRRLLTLHGETGFSCVAWSPNGRRLAASMVNGGTQVWEFTDANSANPRLGASRREGWQRVATGLITRVFDGLQRVVTLVWCPDSKKLICGRGVTTLSVCDVESAILKDLEYRGGYMGLGVALSPDGQLAAFTGAPVTLWHTDTFELAREFPATVITHTCLAWSPDGKALAGADPATQSVVVWDAATGEVALQPAGARFTTSLAYSPNGEVLASGTGSGSVIAWKSDSGVTAYSLPVHRAPMIHVAWSPDGKLLASSSSFLAQSSQVQESSFGRVLHQGFSMCGPVTWSHDGGVLVCVEHNGVFHRYLKMSSRTETVLNVPPATWSWSSDLTMAVGQTVDGACEVWATSPDSAQRICGVPLNNVRAAAFSPDDKTLAVSTGPEIHLCDPLTGEIREKLPPAGAPVAFLGWSPDGTALAAGCEDNNVHLLNIGTKQLVATCAGHTQVVVSLGWADGGKTLISGSESEVCVWDAETGQLLRTIADDCGAISADGRLVASRGQSAIRVWQTRDGKRARTIVSLRDKQFAAISPDGHFTGSPDVEQEFVYVVQTDTGQETLTPDEFTTKYGWKNDPSKITLAPPSEASTEGGQ